MTQHMVRHDARAPDCQVCFLLHTSKICNLCTDLKHINLDIYRII